MFLVYSYAALRITADAVRLWVFAYSSSCWRSSKDGMDTDKDRVRLGSGGLAVFNSGARSGAGGGEFRKDARPKRTTAPRVGRFSNTLSIVVGARSCAYSSGDRENETVVDKRKDSKGRIVSSCLVNGFLTNVSVTQILIFVNGLAVTFLRGNVAECYEWFFENVTKKSSMKSRSCERKKIVNYIVMKF